MYSLLVDCVRLKVMLSWSSTLGGAHSALGDYFTSHVCMYVYICMYVCISIWVHVCI